MMFTGTVINVRDDGFTIDTEVSPSGASATDLLNNQYVVDLRSADID